MTRERDLTAVRQQGKRIRTAHLEVRHIASLLRQPRAGIIVPRYSNTAAERNRVKRRLREIVRLELLPALAAVDLVVRALPSAYHATFAELRAQCAHARERLASEA